MSNVPPPPPPGQPYPQAFAVPPRTSGLAIAAFVFGLLGFVTAGLAGLVGLVLGIVARSGISKNPRLQGKGFALAGMILGIVSMVLYTAILVPTVLYARQSARNAVARSNGRNIGMAVIQYAMDYNDQFPMATNVDAALAPYTGSMQNMVCAPGKPSERMLTYNEKLSGHGLSWLRHPSRTVVYFECKPGTGQAGSRQDVPAEPRYDDGYVVVFADGHVESVSADRLDSLIWDPSQQTDNPWD